MTVILFVYVKLHRYTQLEDIGGKKMKAVDVFAFSIRYLKDDLFETLNDAVSGLQNKDIQWVVTVPAIWDDDAKQFMREAAENVCI